jgi:hypothetical protein
MLGLPLTEKKDTHTATVNARDLESRLYWPLVSGTENLGLHATGLQPRPLCDLRGSGGEDIYPHRIEKGRENRGAAFPLEKHSLSQM